MIKISNIKVDTNHTIQDVLLKAFKVIKTDKINSYYIDKKSLDARNRKGKIQYVYSIVVDIENEHKYLSIPNVSPAKRYELNVPKINTNTRPIVVGSGPCGLFSALVLTLGGAKPIIIERGSDVDTRKEEIDAFWNDGVLNTNSNVQFGEGGAGTFSDGKLTTGVKNVRSKIVLDYLVKFGAFEEIKYLAKPHVGTDILIDVVKNMRNFLIDSGAEFLFNHQLTNINISDNSIESIDVLHNDEVIKFDVEHLFLAVGHSARDTFELIYKKGINVEQKPFAMGVRIEHLQEMVNKVQYGDVEINAAEYKLTANLSDGRGAYTFCMCPGGEVVAAASEENGVVTNGMSYHARDLVNANSALLVNVRCEDFGGTHPLQGMYLQRELEQKAFNLGGKNYYAPVQTVKDFLSDEKSTSLGNVIPTYKPGYTLSNLNLILPDFLKADLKEALLQMNRKFKGFSCDDAILTGIESRTSSPIRIVRDENCMSNIKGIYPCGEGAGYAGGIMSAAIDGINVVEKAFEFGCVETVK